MSHQSSPVCGRGRVGLKTLTSLSLLIMVYRLLGRGGSCSIASRKRFKLFVMASPFEGYSVVRRSKNPDPATWRVEEISPRSKTSYIICSAQCQMKLCHLLWKIIQHFKTMMAQHYSRSSVELFWHRRCATTLAEHRRASLAWTLQSRMLILKVTGATQSFGLLFESKVQNIF